MRLCFHHYTSLSPFSNISCWFSGFLLVFSCVWTFFIHFQTASKFWTEVKFFLTFTSLHITAEPFCETSLAIYDGSQLFPTTLSCPFPPAPRPQAKPFVPVLQKYKQWSGMSRSSYQILAQSLAQANPILKIAEASMIQIPALPHSLHIKYLYSRKFHRHFPISVSLYSPE